MNGHGLCGLDGPGGNLKLEDLRNGHSLEEMPESGKDDDSE
jgi:hypothetical protein